MATALLHPFVLAVATMLAANPVAAAERGGGEAQPVRDEAAIPEDTNFLAAHPDMRWRKLGIRAHEQGRLEQARGYFRRASLYADKISQAAYAEMLWRGEGGAVDRPLAYAWMDLVAQRGTPALLARRERYRAQLDEAERERAKVVGQAVYAEYGDEVAMPRQEREMRTGRRRMTGSRAGAAGLMRICTGVDGGALPASGGPDRGNLFGGGCGRPVSSEISRGTLLEAGSLLALAGRNTRNVPASVGWEHAC